jgi:hypothetical protein
MKVREIREATAELGNKVGVGRPRVATSEMHIWKPVQQCVMERKWNSYPEQFPTG